MCVVYTFTYIFISNYCICVDFYIGLGHPPIYVYTEDQLTVRL
jgi:hypothetical protein